MTKTRKRLDGTKRSKKRLETRVRCVAGVLSVSCCFVIAAAHADGVSNQTWNPGGTGGGPGTWDTTTANWDSATTWTNGNNAIFGGIPGTVTIASGGVTASGLQIDSGTYLIKGAQLTLTGAASIVTNESVRIDSVIGGNAGLNKSGVGILELNAQNTYTGDTNVTAGTLQNDVDNALPTGTNLTVSGQTANYDLNGTTQTVAHFSLQNGATLNDLPGEGLLISNNNFDLQDGQVFAALGGSGGIVKSGPGTVSLYGPNVYTGATLISGGTLIAGNDFVLPNTTVVTVDGRASTLNLNGYAQSVAGLTLSNGGQIVDTVKGGSLTSASDFDLRSGVVDATLAGTVGVNKTTNGTVVLSGHNIYTGLTSVQDGKLIIDGSIVGNAAVTGAGILGGSGFIGGNVVNRGTVSPGNSPGTLTINGNYTQAANGTYLVQLASASLYDRLVVGGRANLNGALQVVTLNGFVPAKDDVFKVLTASKGVAGTFSSLNTGTVLTINAVYEPNDVLLQIDQGSFAGAIRKFHGITQNEKSVAHALDRAASNPRASKLIGYLDTLPVAQLPHDFDLIAPEEYAAFFNIGIEAANVQTANLERRFEDIRAGAGSFSATGLNLHGTSQTIINDNPVSVALYHGGSGKDSKETKTVVPISSSQPDKLGFFITGEGEFVGVSSDGNGSGYDFTTAGTTVGLDYRLGPNFAVGITAGYIHTWTDLIDNGGIEVNGGTGGLYATWFDDDGFYVNGVVSGGGASYDAMRNGLAGTVSGDTSGTQFDSLLGGGYDMHHGEWTFGPTVDLEYTYVSVDNFQENGSIAPLQIAGNNMNSLRSRIGFRTSCTHQIGKISIVPEVRLAWQHEYLDQSGSIDSQFLSGAGGVFNVRGPVLGRDSLLVSAGVSVGLTPSLSVFAYYDGQFGGDNYTANAVSGGVRLSF